MDVNLKGKIIELELLTYITKLGYSVSIPFGDKDKYDQIGDINGKLLRIQIKASRGKNNLHTGIIFNCYSISNGKKHKYTDSDIDYFATFGNGKYYMVNIKECSQEKTLGFINKDNPTCCYAEDYEIEKVLTKI